jgi:hypothetical protein
MGAVRDLKYLTWRYLRHPCFQYRILCVPEGNRTGIIIWRLETIRESTGPGYVDVDRIGRVLEFLPASRENARDLLALLWSELTATDVIGADFYGYHSETSAGLNASGFLNVDGHSDGQMIPSRFQPLEARGGTILSAVFGQDHLASCFEECPGQWYWTQSDADQDRPN